MRKFWLVWNGREGASNVPRFEHLTKVGADEEAQRLARLHPGTRFYVLEALRYWEKNDLKVVDLENAHDVNGEEIPF